MPSNVEYGSVPTGDPAPLKKWKRGRIIGLLTFISTIITVSVVVGLKQKDKRNDSVAPPSTPSPTPTTAATTTSTTTTTVPTTPALHIEEASSSHQLLFTARCSDGTPEMRVFAVDGVTASGHPFFKSTGTFKRNEQEIAKTAYLYFDKKCDNYQSGWVIHTEKPSTTLFQTLHGDGDCHDFPVIPPDDPNNFMPPTSVTDGVNYACVGETTPSETSVYFVIPPDQLKLTWYNDDADGVTSVPINHLRSFTIAGFKSNSYPRYTSAVQQVFYEVCDNQGAWKIKSIDDNVTCSDNGGWTHEDETQQYILDSGLEFSETFPSDDSNFPLHLHGQKTTWVGYVPSYATWQYNSVSYTVTAITDELILTYGGDCDHQSSSSVFSLWARTSDHRPVYRGQIVHGDMGLSVCDMTDVFVFYDKAPGSAAGTTSAVQHVSGVCDHLSGLNSDFTRQGFTADGKPYYKSGPYYLYYDKHCDNNTNTSGRWIFDNDAPNTMTASDLDGDGGCNYYGRIDSAAALPPGHATWRLNCANGYTDVPLTIAAARATVSPQVQEVIHTEKNTDSSTHIEIATFTNLIQGAKYLLDVEHSGDLNGPNEYLSVLVLVPIIGSVEIARCNPDGVTATTLLEECTDVDVSNFVDSTGEIKVYIQSSAAAGDSQPQNWDGGNDNYAWRAKLTLKAPYGHVVVANPGWIMSTVSPSLTLSHGLDGTSGFIAGQWRDRYFGIDPSDSQSGMPLMAHWESTCWERNNAGFLYRTLVTGKESRFSASAIPTHINLKVGVVGSFRRDITMSGLENVGCHLPRNTGGQAFSISGQWDYEGRTADGKGFYSRDVFGDADGVVYLYFDSDFRGLNNRWFLSDTKPSIKAMSDLGGGGAIIYAYSKVVATPHYVLGPQSMNWTCLVDEWSSAPSGVTITPVNPQPVSNTEFRKVGRTNPGQPYYKTIGTGAPLYWYFDHNCDNPTTDYADGWWMTAEEEPDDTANRKLNPNCPLLNEHRFLGQLARKAQVLGKRTDGTDAGDPDREILAHGYSIPGTAIAVVYPDSPNMVAQATWESHVYNSYSLTDAEKMCFQ